jgi:hypothetical protein
VSEPVVDPDRRGQSRFIAFITPVVPFGRIWLRGVFALGRRYPKLLRIGRLKVVHFTQWSLLTSIPYNGAPQIRERPSRPMLLWGSMFNGEVDPYIEAFVATVSKQIWLTWRTSYDYPGTKSVTKLCQYIAAASWPGSYAYSAYPDSTVRMIDAAFEIRREHAFLADVASTGDADAFRLVYEGFLRRCGRLL